MKHNERTQQGESLTGGILDLFRLTSLLSNAGDRLVSHLGLTSSRWQILGAMMAAPRPQPVAWLARDLGAHRQNVQRIVHDLRREGMVAFESNPHHKKAQLVVFTDKGKRALEAAMQLQAPWINSISQGLSLAEIETFKDVVQRLRLRLEAAQGETERE